MKKKIMALILSVALIGTYGVVGAVFADEDGKPIHNGTNGYDLLQTAIDEAADGDTISIDKPVEVDKTVDVSKSVTLKLNADLTVKGESSGYKAGMLTSKDVTLNITSENGSKLKVTGFYEGFASSNSYVSSSSYPETFYSIQLNIQGNAVADFSGNTDSGMYISAGENGSVINVEQGAGLLADNNGEQGCKLIAGGKTAINVRGEASFSNNYTGILHMFDDGDSEITIEADGGVLNLNSNENTGIDTAKFGTIRAMNGGIVNIKENTNSGAQNATFVADDKGTINVENNESWGIFYCAVTAESGGTINAVNNSVGIGDYNPGDSDPFGGLTVKTGAKVLLSGNNFGLYLNQPGIQVNVEEGADFNVTNNQSMGIFSRKENIKINLLSGKITDNNCSKEDYNGAGITNFYGDVVIGGTCQIWNNSTTGFGDDIANFRGTVTLRDQSSDNLTLKDGKKVTGWYYDGKKDGTDKNRWGVSEYYEEVTGGKLNATGATGIKAAYGKAADPYIPPATVDPEPDPEPEPVPGEGGEIIDDPDQGETDKPKEQVEPEETSKDTKEEKTSASSKTDKAENNESGNPQTGDNSMMALYAVIALGAAGAAVGLTFKKRKEQ